MMRYNLASFTMYALFAITFCLVVVGYKVLVHSTLDIRLNYARNIFSFDIAPANNSGWSVDTISSGTRTLVIYVYGKTHPLSEENFVFFIRTAVRASHDADYYFILQRTNDFVLDEKKLPILPSNAHYIHHENKCFDLGTVGWFLASNTVDTTKYKYLIVLNSSVRGPFIVAYYDSSVWYRIFTRRLNDQIKLMGCTISCEIAIHVQSYFWAMDFQTVKFLLKNSSVFACHQSMTDTILKGEIGASQAILNSGFGIDSLMNKYQGVDFRADRTKKCADKGNPTFNKGTNGITLDPYEVVFVKMKKVADQDLENRARVQVYEQWLHH